MARRTPIEAPHFEGFAICPTELILPESRLDLSNEYSYNNHHRMWTARKFGRSALFQTLRDLESSQVILPKDVHAAYHKRYSPPPMPTPLKALDRIQDAYDRNERLRYGSAREPEYTPIIDGLLKRLKRAYEALV